MIELQGIYPAALDVTDASGNLANASTVILTITLPDGTTTSPAVANPPASTGHYQVPYLTSQPGRHVVRWVTTGPNTAYTDVFDVSEAQTPSILSLADIRTTLGYDPLTTGDDKELREKLAAITKAVEDYKHETIVQRTITQKHVISGTWAWTATWSTSSRLRLLKVPVISLTSVVATNGSFTWDTANLDVDNDTGLVSVISGPPVIGRVTSVHVAGYQIIPYNYIEGAKVLFQAVWETRRGPGGESGVIGPEELNDFRHYTSMPRKVTEWLGPPRPVVM